MSSAAQLFSLSAMAEARPEGVRQVPFVLYGVGGVGSELIRSVVRARELHASRYGVRLSAVGVCDSSGAVCMEQELSDATLAELVEHKAAGGRLCDFAGAVTPGAHESVELFLPRISEQCSKRFGAPILVDCTASDATVPARKDFRRDDAPHTAGHPMLHTSILHA